MKIALAWCRPVLALVALLFSIPGAVRAKVKPSDFIDPANAAKDKDFVPPGVFQNVTHGMTMKIVPTGRIDWPPPYKDAMDGAGEPRTEFGSGNHRCWPDILRNTGSAAYSAGLLADNDVLPLSFEITFTGILPPFFEDRYEQRDTESFRIASGVGVAPGVWTSRMGAVSVWRTSKKPSEGFTPPWMIRSCSASSGV